MSDDELNLLALLLSRHGHRAVIAALAMASDQQVNKFAEDGSFHLEKRWRQYADFFRAFAALITERHTSTE